MYTKLFPVLLLAALCFGCGSQTSPSKTLTSVSPAPPTATPAPPTDPSPAPPTPPSTTTPAAPQKMVVLVIDENHDLSDVLADMPWLVSQGNANGYAANYHSDNGGSLLDYLWLASGSCESNAECTLPASSNNFGCSGNSCTAPITDDNIFRELNKAGLTWKVYAQSYTAAGGTPTTPDKANGTDYYRRHNGAVWYSDILSNVDNSAANVVDLSQLSTDIAKNSLPNFMIIVPDGNHDAHDCPVGMTTCTTAQTLAAADQFLQANLGPILNTAPFQAGGDGLAFVTFDECSDGTDEGCNANVYLGVIGPQVIPHTVSNAYYKHENTLRTMLDALGVRTYPGASASASDESDFFASEDKVMTAWLTGTFENRRYHSSIWR